MKFIPLIIFFLFSISAEAQSDIKKLKKNLSVLENYDYQANEDLNIDSIANSTEQQLISILKYKAIKETDHLPNLDITYSKDKKITAYTFSYNTGGTEKAAYFPVIQWKNAHDSICGAYALSNNSKSFSGISGYIDIVYKLPCKDKNLYLIMGGDEASGRTFIGFALVVQVKKNYLLLDYPAFYNEAPLLYFSDDLASTEDDNVCMGCMDYVEKTRTLMVGINRDYKEKAELGDDDEVGVMKLSGFVNKLPAGQKTMSFYFNGENFELKK